jgi:alpha-mannosidase
MHQDRQISEDRLTRVLRERIQPAVFGPRVSCRVQAWHVPGEPVPVAEALSAQFRPIEIGDAWGPPWSTTWLHITGRIPAEFAGARVDLHVDLGFHPEHEAGFQAEGLLYTAKGSPVKGLHPLNCRYQVGRPAVRGQEIDFYVEAAANPFIACKGVFGPTNMGDRRTAPDAPLYRLATVDLVVVEPEVEQFARDVEVLDGLMRQLDESDPRRHGILRSLERMLALLDPDDVAGTCAAAREALAPAFASPAVPSAHQISAVGHAHIDSAWLWPLRETVRKSARTFLNVLELSDRRPELIFACSQAQQYAWMKEHYPEVFRRIREKVAAGTFVPVGGMWVESDTNLPGGESLVRQFVFGKRFFLDEFGVDPQEVWLPDSFGYSAALPQIAQLAGMRWFLTQKMSWNQTNEFPHHTFWWEGLDGTRLFAHFPSADTYRSSLHPEELAHASRTFAEKGRASRSLVPFGYGDGGGGPTEQMLDWAARQRDLEGSPRVAIDTPARFFQLAQDEYADAPTWAGELYLEAHRATYTTQALMKKGNRRCEHLLREAELWSATAACLVDGFKYPYDALESAWQTVLLHQFHDILPGSSIAWVHREAAESYLRIADELETLVDAALDALAGESAESTVFNSAPMTRLGVAALGAGPPAPIAADPVIVTRRDDGGWRIGNGLLTVDLDPHGVIIGLRDHVEDRDVLPPNSRANLLQLHRDLPVRWDAWDVENYYRETVEEIDQVSDVIAVENGVEVVRAFGDSRATQAITLAPGVREVDFVTSVDWHEREKFLKVAFPVAVRAEASLAETQFGHVSRPTHSNTSWDAARFELCAHRWLYVGEPGYGVALANDSTYGYDVTRRYDEVVGTVTTMRLSLLRAPRFPDPETDQGSHNFRYRLVAGATVGDAVNAGYDLNLPVRVRDGGGPITPLVRVDNPAVVVETVKLADDRSGDLIIRMYEALGGRAAVNVTFGVPHRAVRVVDLLERPLHDRTSAFDGSLTLRPFQLVTLRVTVEAGSMEPDQ